MDIGDFEAVRATHDAHVVGAITKSEYRRVLRGAHRTISEALVYSDTKKAIREAITILEAATPAVGGAIAWRDGIYDALDILRAADSK